MLTSDARQVMRRSAVPLLAAVVLFAATACGNESTDPRAERYCATLPDSIGLYVGNPVTQMGYQIGTVDRITPSLTSVQVDFSLNLDRPLPADVHAVVRSPSILADRALELVGNYVSGPRLEPEQCVPQDRSLTPKSLSESIGAANELISGINPKDSQNIGETLELFDRAMQNNGGGINQILSTSSRLLDNPDRALSDIKSIVFNTASLTHTIVDLRDPIKGILNDARVSTPDLHHIMDGAARFIGPPLDALIMAASDLETHAGDQTQLALDAISDILRINSPHTRGWISAFGGILQSVPWWINAIANHYNGLNYFPLSYRPPMYRIRTPNGAVVCNQMNFWNPGSCANVAGQPYGVDINLLQYVFAEASR